MRPVINTESGKRDILKALEEGVVAACADDSSFLKLTGKDVPDYINRISTNQVKNLLPLSCRRTIFTNEKGRIIDLTRYMNFGEFQLLAGTKENGDKLKRWIERYLLSDDVNVTDVTGDYGVIKLTGRCVDRYVYAKFGEDTSELGLNNIRPVKFEGKSFSIIRPERGTGYPELLIMGNPEDIGILFNQLQLPGDEELPVKISPSEYEALLVELGVPGKNELRDLFNPHELNLLNAVDFKKGCYIGQEVIARLDTYNKVQKYLCRFEICGDEVVGKDYLIYDHNEEIGRVTSVTRSVISGKPIALGVLKKGYPVKGNKVAARGENHSEEVCLIVKTDREQLK
ncbi:MAG: folate-binding protein YgfZ [Ignavibacteriaceae bacterium]